jgi:hypothetical protein
MYGPKFNDDTAAVWTVAMAVAAGTVSGSTGSVLVG